MSSGLKEFKMGWKSVLASAIGIGFGLSPLPFYTLGVFIGPYAGEFGWQVTEILLGFTVLSILVLFTAPMIGNLADKVGVRKVVMVSLVLFGLSMMAFSLQTGSKLVYLLIWASVAITGTGTLPITYTRIVIQWFKKKRGLALGIALLFTGVLGSASKLYANYFIQNFGWREAYIALGLLPIVFALPLAYFFLKAPTSEEAEQLKADWSNDAGDEVPSEGFTLKEAFSDKKFWLLIMTFLPISFAVGGPIPNLETIFKTYDFDVNSAAVLAALLGFPAVFVGRLLGGYLMDRLWAPGIAFAFFLLPVGTCLIFQMDSITYAQAVMAVVMLGFAAGVEYDLMAYIVSRYFGLKNYSAIYGAIYAVFAVGAGFGPAIFGYFYDVFGSYSSIFFYAMIAFVVGAIPLLFLGKYRYE